MWGAPCSPHCMLGAILGLTPAKPRCGGPGNSPPSPIPLVAPGTAGVDGAVADRRGMRAGAAQKQRITNEKKEDLGQLACCAPPPTLPFLLCSFQWNEMVFATAPLPHAEHHPVLGDVTRLIPLPPHGTSHWCSQQSPAAPVQLPPTSAPHGWAWGALLVTPEQGGSILREGTSE